MSASADGKSVNEGGFILDEALYKSTKYNIKLYCTALVCMKRFVSIAMLGKTHAWKGAHRHRLIDSDPWTARNPWIGTQGQGPMEVEPWTGTHGQRPMDRTHGLRHVTQL